MTSNNAPVSLRWLAIALAVLGVAAAVVWGAERWANTAARAEADATAAQMARSHAGLLASELQKFRLLPLVLSEYPDARTVLERDDPAAVARLNDRLELLAKRTDAAVIYVIGRDGRTVAASNWRLPTSFVGQDYGFRPYFRGALARGNAELFALGTVSGRPGLFIAQRIEGGGRTLGVIVAKVEFDALEAGWARQPGPTFVTDGHGVIIITSRPAWRFRATRPLDDAARNEIRQSIQFGALPLAPLGIGEARGGVRVDGSDGRYRLASVPVPLAGAHLSYMQPLEPAEASAAANARVAVLSGLIAATLALAWLWRARVRRRALEEARSLLEGEVAARTAELRDANTLLIAESAEREAADRRFRAAREELAQANRLGSIGQITAGVAHEINQPVAAIRTFAENAAKFLDRTEPDRARTNLSHIVDLTDRIGRITGELRTFARRGTPAVGAVALDTVIDGALLLIGDRIRGVTLDRTGDIGGVRVVADKVRLEQVLINLIQNALDALADTPGPRIAIAVAAGPPVMIDVADNGPGIAADIADQLFTPFVTGKRDGLGLGLGIARDIVREFGGKLETLESPLGGAAFRITLSRA